MILRIFIFLLAILSAGGAAWLTFQSGSDHGDTSGEIAAEPAPMVDVLIADRDIAGGEMLAGDQLRWESWPEANIHDQFITRAARPDAMQALAGTFVRTGFADGEPIRESRLATANQNLLSNRIAPGMRAAAVKVSAESAAGGFILPGDRVDVIQTVTGGDMPRNASRIIISNARVLAIDQTVAQTQEGTAIGKTATLELRPSEAALIMAAEATGLLSLALRAVSDHAEPTPIAEPAATVSVRRGSERTTVSIR